MPPVPPPGYDPRDYRRYLRDQARAQREAFKAQRQQMRYQMRGMRRGSVLGPILLIAIGIIFLLIQTGRLDHQKFWGWYGHWWPLLLVVGGLVVLVEWALDQRQMRDPQQIPYRRSLGGGVFTLLLFIVIAGFIARNVGEFPDGTSRLFPGYHFDQDSLDQFFGDKHESDQTLDFAFNAGSSLAVVNPRGDVTVNGTSDDNRIHISVHKQVYARSDSDADTKAQQLVPATASYGSSFTLTMPAIEGGRADLVIAVPATAATTVTANHGDIHVASIKAPVAATANHGDVELSAITGAVNAHINNSGSSVSAHSIDGGFTVRGRGQDVTLADISGPVSINGDFFGATHLEHIRGTVRYHTSRTDFQLARLDGEADISPHADLSADQVLGPVVLTTSNHNITLDRVSGDVAVTDRNGTIDLTASPTLGTITLEDRNDSIKVTLPERASFSIQADTTDGHIDTDLTLPTQAGPQNDGRHSTLTGSSGGGGPLVRITTTNGDISLHKGDIPPLAPLPPAPPKITLAPPTPPPAPGKKH